MTAIRLAIVGGGRVFERFHLPALRRSGGWTPIGACDPSPERRAWLGRTLGTAVYEDHEEMLRRAAPDAVLIASPPASHAPVAIAALAVGAHVLVEKPMTVDPAEARAMIEAARASRRVLRVGLNRRFRRPYESLRQRVRGWGRDAIDSLRSELVVDPGGDSASAFRRAREPGSSVLDDVACHQLDLLAWITGREISRVRVGGVEEGAGDSRVVTYTVELDGGPSAACVSGHGSRYTESLEVASPSRRVLAHASGVVPTRWVPRSLVGPLSSISVASHLASRRLLGRPNVTAESFAAQLAAFAAAVGGRSEVETGADGKSGLRAVLATRALERSLERNGHWETVDRTDGVEG